MQNFRQIPAIISTGQLKKTIMLKKTIFFKELSIITKANALVCIAILLVLLIAAAIMHHLALALIIISALSIFSKVLTLLLNLIYKNHHNQQAINILADTSIILMLASGILYFIGPELHLLTGKLLILSTFAPLVANGACLLIYILIAYIHYRENPESCFNIGPFTIKHKTLIILASITLLAIIIFMAFPALISFHLSAVTSLLIINITVPLYGIYKAANIIKQDSKTLAAANTNHPSTTPATTFVKKQLEKSPTTNNNTNKKKEAEADEKEEATNVINVVLAPN